jgi:hypothetical protein
VVIPNSHPWNQLRHKRQLTKTYSKIDTTKFRSLLSFERESINGHQANDEKEGVDQHFEASYGV